MNEQPEVLPVTMDIAAGATLGPNLTAAIQALVRAEVQRVLDEMNRALENTRTYGLYHQ